MIFYQIIHLPSLLKCLLPYSLLQPWYPVIFDTGASLAITPHLTDFVEPLSDASSNLKLGGMANRLTIAGKGLLTWIFPTTTGVYLPVSTMAYYVPDAKVCLISPQRVFDLHSGKEGSYFGDHQSLQLHLQGHIISIPYDARNSLPIGYAFLPHSTPQSLSYLALHDVSNQNLTSGQKLLLRWHHWFGYLNLPAVQQILQPPHSLLQSLLQPALCWDLESKNYNLKITFILDLLWINCYVFLGHVGSCSLTTSPLDLRTRSIDLESW